MTDERTRAVGAVVRRLSEMLDEGGDWKAFQTIQFVDILKMLNDEKVNLERPDVDLTYYLSRVGIKAYPSLKTIAGYGGYTRLYRTGSVFGGLVDAFNSPNKNEDRMFLDILYDIERRGYVEYVD